MHKPIRKLSIKRMYTRAVKTIRKASKSTGIRLAVLGMAFVVFAGLVLLKNVLSPTEYKLTRLSPSLDGGVVVKQNFETKIEMSGPPQRIWLTAVIDTNKVERREVDLKKQEQHAQTISTDIANLTDGEHKLELSMRDNAGAILAAHSYTFVKDTVPPTAVENPNITIINREPKETSFSINFSEIGTFSIESTQAGELIWSKEATSSPTITIPAGAKPFTTMYQFTDQVGYVASGNINYSYDNVPPKITLISRAEVTNRYSLKYLAEFNVSEPISSSYIMFNGQKITTHLTPPAKYTGLIVLSMGSNTFSISATDKYGNTTNQNFTVTMKEDPFPKKSPLSPGYRFCTREIKKPCDEKYPDHMNNCAQWDQYILCVRAKCDSPVGNNKCL